jgi:transcriptional regulator with GAF, ATPase, and Fis domain
MQSPDGATGDLARVVFEERLDANLQQVADVAVRTVQGCDMAGVTLIRRGRPVTAVFTDPEAPEIDTAQYETGEGPCLEAFHRSEILKIADTRSETRWPAFARIAAEHGVLSTLSLPLAVGDDAIGALNLYSRELDQFADDSTAQVFGLQAAVVLANAQAFVASHQLSKELERALESRAVIEQAKGIIIATRRCSADEAFEVLRTQSQYENRKLREVARDVVDGAGRQVGPPEAD